MRTGKSLTNASSAEPAISSRLSRWNQTQQAVAATTLAHCPRFPELAARHEAWWRRQLSGPPLLLNCSLRRPGASLEHFFNLLSDPQAWLAARLAQLDELYFPADSLPYLHVDFGPTVLAAVFAGHAELVSDTLWVQAFIQSDWANAPHWSLDGGRPASGSWWQQVMSCFELACQAAAGQCLVMTPNLGGAADVLLNLRGSGPLCLDLYDRPDQIRRALNGIHPAWETAFARLWEVAAQSGTGLLNWVGVWSSQPYVVLECDFSYMVGPAVFRDLLLSGLARQAAAVGRSIYHLDGPDATRHIDAILEIPEIQAIQYVAGAGNSALDKLPMLQKIQACGRALQIATIPDEVLPLSRSLDPAGLAFLLRDPLQPGELERIVVGLGS